MDLSLDVGIAIDAEIEIEIEPGVYRITRDEPRRYGR